MVVFFSLKKIVVFRIIPWAKKCIEKHLFQQELLMASLQLASRIVFSVLTPSPLESSNSYRNGVRFLSQFLNDLIFLKWFEKIQINLYLEI